MSSKSILSIFTDMIQELVQEYNIGEYGITEITVSPYIFNLLDHQEFISKVDTYSNIPYDRLLNPPSQATIMTQMGKLTIKKDITQIIKCKKNLVDILLKEIEDLKNEN